MVYTRSQKVETLTAARTLVSLKNSTYSLRQQSTESKTRMAKLMATLTTTEPSQPTDTQFWSNWTAWYHTFVSEVHDETTNSKGRFVEAERRWAAFCAKKMRCDLSTVEAWLKFTDTKSRLAIAGF